MGGFEFFGGLGYWVLGIWHWILMDTLMTFMIYEIYDLMIYERMEMRMTGLITHTYFTTTLPTSEYDTRIGIHVHMMMIDDGTALSVYCAGSVWP